MSDVGERLKRFRGVYFVSYAFTKEGGSWGYGNAEVTGKGLIENVKALRGIEADLNKGGGEHVILGFALLRYEELDGTDH